MMVIVHFIGIVPSGLRLALIGLAVGAAIPVLVLPSEMHPGVWESVQFALSTACGASVGARVLS